MAQKAKAFARHTQPKKEQEKGGSGNGYNHSTQSGIYPLSNPINKGYGVTDPEVSAGEVAGNGRWVNQANEKIDFWIEDITATFGMTGSKAQSRSVREFMPHNVNQPAITVKGRAANSFQYNRMASFVRTSHWNSLNLDQLGDATRQILLGEKGETRVNANTIRFILRARPEGMKVPWKGRNVKGSHVPWVLEGYVKGFKAGAERFEVAPQFEFEYFVSASQGAEGGKEIGIWNDIQVLGRELQPWTDWISKGKNNFVTVHDKAASKQYEGGKQRSNPVERDYSHNHEDPGASAFDEPSSKKGLAQEQLYPELEIP